jgi:hypothetical protein
MSVRVGRQGLSRLSERLSDRDRELIHTIGSHRFMTGKQIARFHFADHASPDTGARVCRQVLARLAREGVLRRLQRRVGGVRAGSSSYVYMLGPAGRRLVGDELARQVREPSATFLRHTLAIVDAHLTLRDGAREGRFELEMVEAEPACWRRYLGSGGARETLRPDLFVITAAGALEFCWFLEIDLGTEFKPTLIHKCRAYETYWRTGIEQQRSGTFPLVAWVVPTEQRRQELERAIGSARGLKRELFRVAEAQGLVELVAGGAS